jgi:hypothetical protein
MMVFLGLAREVAGTSGTGPTAAIHGGLTDKLL